MSKKTLIQKRCQSISEDQICTDLSKCMTNYLHAYLYKLKAGRYIQKIIIYCEVNNFNLIILRQ